MGADPLTDALNVQSPELEEVDLLPTLKTALSEAKKPAVLQVVILRDGLLVGTEVFLPGDVAVGSEGDLALDGLAPRHARFVLCGGQVTVEALGGDVFVNGNPISVTPVRPVDDVLVGPYALKLRVLGQRKAPPAPRPAARLAAEGPTVVIPPPPARRATGAQKLFLELCWGDQRVEARAFGPLPAAKPLRGAEDDRAAMPLWGFGLAAPMVLAVEHGGGYRVFVPAAAAVERRDADGDFQPLRAARHVDLQPGDAVRFTSERTALVARVGPAEAAPFVNPLKGLPHVALAVTALLLAAFGAFVSLAPTEDEAEFALKAMPRAEVKALFEAPKPKAEPKAQIADRGSSKRPDAHQDQRPVPPRRTPPRGKQVLPFGGQAFSSLLDLKLPDVSAAAGPRPPGRTASIIKDGGPRLPPGVPFGIGPGGSTIGLNGLGARKKFGDMDARAFGGFAVAGQVTGPGRKAGPAPQGPGIDKNAVRKVIDAHAHVISGCYERAMIAEKDSGGGRLSLEWGISTSGQVTFARTKSSSMKTSAVERCILAALKTWEFPKATRAGVIVTYPFLFNSVGF